MAAPRQRRPDEPVPIDVDPSRGMPLNFGHRVIERRLVHLGDAGLRRVVPALQADDGARERSKRPRNPDRIVHPVWNHPVGKPHGPRVPRRVDRFARLVPRPCDLAISVRVQHGWAPPLRRPFVPRLIQHPRVQPSYGVGVPAEPQRVVHVFPKLQVVRRIAGVDQHELLRRRVEIGQVPRALVDGEVRRGRMIRSLPAPVLRVRAAHGRGHPHAPLPVHHRIVGIGGVSPHLLVAVVVRRLSSRRIHPVPPRRDGVRIETGWNLQLGGRIRMWVDDDQLAVSTRHPVDRPVRIDLGVSFVAGDLVVDIGSLHRPIPHGQNQISLNPLGPRRRGWNLPGGNAVGPIRIHRESSLPPESAHGAAHGGAALARSHAVIPRGQSRVEPVAVIDLARDPVAQLVAALAPLFHGVNPLRLTPKTRVDPVPIRPGAGKLTLRGHLDQRVPVVGRIHLGGLHGAGGQHGGERQLLPRRALDTGRIDEPIPSHPHVVARLREIGQQVASFIVGHDNLHERGRQILRFRNHPDAGLTPLTAPDHAGDLAATRARGLIGFRLLTHPGERPSQAQGHAHYPELHVEPHSHESLRSGPHERHSKTPRRRN